MRLASTTIASLVLTIGALFLLVAVDGTKQLRSDSSRKLYNYSRNNGNNYNYNNGGNNYNNANNGNSYNGGYGGSYGGNDDANQNDDAAAAYNQYNDDGSSYYNSNSNYADDGSYYNGRDQQWGGQSVQQYTDDEEPEVYVSEYEEDGRWEILGKFGGLSGAETLAVAALAAALSISFVCLFLLASGFNVCDLFQHYFCCGACSQPDAETGDDGFVKLGDY